MTPFSLLVKPVGARCNLACDYCFYLDKAALYPNGPAVMPDEILERMVSSYLALPFDSHAMAFQTPRGTMVVAWDRSEGFILNRDHEKGRRYASPEPWVEQWTKTVEVSFPVVGEAISVNVIGQTRRLPSHDGKSTVRLTGAPIIVYGLDRNRLAFYAKTEDNLGATATAVFDSCLRNKVIPESSKIK